MLFRYAMLGVACAAAIALGVSGCARPADSDASGEHEGHDHEEHGHDHADHKHDDQTSGHVHGTWWCDEHGVPEEVCGLCSSKVAAELKKKGDWCSEHNRPDSQCFVCHPEQEAKFAALYEAKYGKSPPKRN